MRQKIDGIVCKYAPPL